MILLRKALRDVRAMGIRAVLLVLVIGTGVGLAAGIQLALHDIRATRDAFYRNQALADLDLRLRQPLPTGVLAARARRARARSAETRLILDGNVLTSSGPTAAEVVGMPPHARLDRLAITAGRPLDAADPLGAAVDVDYAQRAHLQLGDRLELRLGDRRLRVRVRALARSPEYLLATADPQYLFFEPGSLAVLFLPRAGLAAAVAAPGLANDLVLDLPTGTRPDAQSALTAGLPVAQLTPRSQQLSLRLTDIDLHSFALFVPVLAAVFATVGLLLIALSLRRLVYAQRRELGTLLAIGYGHRAVLATALLPATLLALPGAAVAVAATLAIGWLVATEYATAIGFPTIVHTLALAPLALAALLALAATLAAALLPAWTLARLTPTSAMHGDQAVRFQPPRWLRRATGASPQLAYALRSLARRPLLTAATVLSLAAAIGLGAALNLLAASANRAVDETFAGQGWTASADLTRPLPTATAVALAHRSGATAVEPIPKGPARLSVHGRTAEVELLGLPTAPALLRPRITAGRPASPSQILLSEQTAGALHLHPGQPVQVTTATGSRRLTVSGTARTLASSQSYLPAAEAAALLALTGRTNTLFLRSTDPGIQKLRAQPEIARVSSLATARTGMHTAMRELTGLIDVLLAISLAVGGLFLVSSLALSFLDRQSEFATLRALGYGRSRITTILATETLTQTLLAAALSIPAGLLIAWPLTARITQAWFRIALQPTPSDFIPVIAPALALALLAAAHAIRRILHLDIATTVRARLIG